MSRLRHPTPHAGRVVDVVVVSNVGFRKDGCYYHGSYGTNAKNGFGLVFKV